MEGDEVSQDRARTALAKELEQAKGWGKKHRYIWSFATHGTAWMIPSLSAAAGILSRFNNDLGGISLPVLATILSACVVVISSAQLSVGFRRKWASYRTTQTGIRLLALDLEMGKPLDEVRARLEKIYKAHDDAVIGGNPSEAVQPKT
jgi:hypothetical protein